MKEYHTKYKDLIQTYIDEHKDSRLSASGIYDAMKEQGIKINLATVYRHLDKLTADGTLRKYKTTNDKSSYYQYASAACSSHLHLQCSRCGKIIHLNCDFMNTIYDHLLNEHGFALDCDNSILAGLCEDCRKELENA